MPEQTQIEKVAQLIRANTIGVISTVSRDYKPESAVIGFVMLEDFNLIFGTFSTSRKYQNLQSNQCVSMVIGWDEGRTAQLDGLAEEITDPHSIDESIVRHLSKIPSVAKFFDKPDQRLFRIKPTSIRYTDLSMDPWEYFEVKF